MAETPPQVGDTTVPDALSAAQAESIPVESVIPDDVVDDLADDVPDVGVINEDRADYYRDKLENKRVTRDETIIKHAGEGKLSEAGENEMRDDANAENALPADDEAELPDFPEAIEPDATDPEVDEVIGSNLEEEAAAEESAEAAQVLLEKVNEDLAAARAEVDNLKRSATHIDTKKSKLAAMWDRANPAQRKKIAQEQGRLNLRQKAIFFLAKSSYDIIDGTKDVSVGLGKILWSSIKVLGFSGAVSGTAAGGVLAAEAALPFAAAAVAPLATPLTAAAGGLATHEIGKAGIAEVNKRRSPWRYPANRPDNPNEFRYKAKKALTKFAPKLWGQREQFQGEVDDIRQTPARLAVAQETIQDQATTIEGQDARMTQQTEMMQRQLNMMDQMQGAMDAMQAKIHDLETNYGKDFDNDGHTGPPPQA